MLAVDRKLIWSAKMQIYVELNRGLCVLMLLKLLANHIDCNVIDRFLYLDYASHVQETFNFWMISIILFYDFWIIFYHSYFNFFRVGFQYFCFIIGPAALRLKQSTNLTFKEKMNENKMPFLFLQFFAICKVCAFNNLDQCCLGLFLFAIFRVNIFFSGLKIFFLEI